MESLYGPLRNIGLVGNDAIHDSSLMGRTLQRRNRARVDEHKSIDTVCDIIILWEGKQL